jgi:hypothetical protein
LTLSRFQALTVLLAFAAMSVPFVVSSSLNMRINGFIAGILLLVVLGASKESEAPHVLKRVSPLVLTVEAILLLGMLLSTTLSKNYERSPVFFVLLAAFEVLLFVDVSETKASFLSAVMKIGLGSLIGTMSLSSLYPGFIGVDSYRDFTIASRIIAHGGGLPAPFQNIIWYNLTPTAPLLYASEKFVSGQSLQGSELSLGFVFAFFGVVGVGAITKALTRDWTSPLKAMWLVGLTPYFWMFSGWPIPEMLAVAMLVTLVALLLRSDSPSLALPISILVSSVILTHGGVSLLLIAIAGVLYLIRRTKVTLVALSLASISFVTYAFYASVQGISSGIYSIYYSIEFFVSRITIPGVGATLPSVTPLESVISSYWWILLGVLTWLSISQVNRAQRTNVTSLRTIGGVAILLVASGIVITNFAPNGDASRYLALPGFIMLAVPAAVMVPFGTTPLKKFGTLVILGLFVTSAIASPQFSPDLWQSAGQQHFAAVNRLQLSTTIEEMSSQSFVNNYDNRFLVLGNYLLQFVNITSDSFGVRSEPYAGTIYDKIGVVPPQEVIAPPYIIVISDRATTSGFSDGHPLASITPYLTDLVYDNRLAQIGFQE